MSLFPGSSPRGWEYGGRVRILSPEVAHRIAAGKVIECPAPAVKELIENSLDAASRRVEAEVGEGGTSRILVRDDGSGMSPLIIYGGSQDKFDEINAAASTIIDSMRWDHE